MNLIKILQKEFPRFNLIHHCENEAKTYCKEKKVYIVETSKVKYGKYIRYKGVDFILINPKLSLGMRLWVLWHEVCHFILHTAETSYFSQLTVRKKDREANFGAAMFLIPQEFVKTKLFADIEDEYGLTRPLIDIRKYIWDNEKE